MPRKRDIEAAIAAYNADQASRVLLPPEEATRLLAVMFPRRSVCQRSHADLLIAQRCGDRTLRNLLRALIDSGFITRDRPGKRGLIATYHLHLPPVRR